MIGDKYTVRDLDVVCPTCGSSDIEVFDILELYEKIDEDQEFEYFLAELELECFNCGEVFTSTGTVIKEKEVEE